MIFSKEYFENTKYYSDSINESYCDHVSNNELINKILSYKPKNVLEIGCCKGYVLKNLDSHGIKGIGLEISDYCIENRVFSNIIKFDITKTPWEFENNSFDLCFSMGVLYYIPESKIDNVCNEIKRISKNHLIGIKFDKNAPKDAILKKSKLWWNKKLEGIQSSDTILSIKNI